MIEEGRFRLEERERSRGYPPLHPSPLPARDFYPGYPGGYSAPAPYLVQSLFPREHPASRGYGMAASMPEPRYQDDYPHPDTWRHNDTPLRQDSTARQYEPPRPMAYNTVPAPVPTRYATVGGVYPPPPSYSDTRVKERPQPVPVPMPGGEPYEGRPPYTTEGEPEGRPEAATPPAQSQLPPQTHIVKLDEEQYHRLCGRSSNLPSEKIFGNVALPKYKVGEDWSLFQKTFLATNNPAYIPEDLSAIRWPGSSDIQPDRVAGWCLGFAA